MKRFAKKIARVARMPRARLRLWAEAAVWLAAARVTLAVVPFPRIARHLGGMQPVQPGEPIRQDEVPVAREVGWAVNAAANRSPLEMVCLPRALAARQMLQRRGVASRLHFGAPLPSARTTADFQTHAWLTASGVEVTGFPVAHDCVELGFFSRDLPRAEAPAKLHPAETR